YCRPTTLLFFFSSRRRHTRSTRDWSSDVCSSDLVAFYHDFSQQFTLALVKRFILRPRVSARILGIFGLDGELHEAPAQALHLLRSEERRVGKECRCRCAGEL